MEKLTTLFVGSISTGITDAFLTSLFSACGSLRSFKRLTGATGKPQAFGFAEFEEPDSVSRALSLLNGLQLPAIDSDDPPKKLLVKADDKTRAFLDVYESQRMRTDADDTTTLTAQTLISSILSSLSSGAPPPSADPMDTSEPKKRENFVIPPHLQDLQEADLPENQRGLVISEIALFRERAAKRERDKAQAEKEKSGGMGMSRSAGVGGFSGIGGMGAVPSGPKERVWGRPGGHQQQSPGDHRGGFGQGPQGFSKPVGFVRGGEDGRSGYDEQRPEEIEKTDEELERERKEARRRDEEASLRDRERRYEPRERTRIAQIERVISRDAAIEEAQLRDREEMKKRLEVWDDDESDELFYVDRAKWRIYRQRHLATELAADASSRALEARQAEHLRAESEAFLARQMEEMRSLAEEQRKAGLLLEDGAPVRLSIAAVATDKSGEKEKGEKEKGVAGMFGVEEEEEGVRKRKGPMVKLDFAGMDGVEARKERLEKVRNGVSNDKDVLWKTKIRWEALPDQLIDTKMERLAKRKMTSYLGELDDDDLVMFVLEHLKDHKGPQKLVEGLEPVLEEEANEFVVSLWRQVVFESGAYLEGLETGEMVVD
ncbi:hypothetical protein BOTBODRAFT_38252 [Botryobasidium botryosum FD-172 SS1]|uniref:PWI domain-containing protein n=1 Tax=Botryobasidium botryosum (strain FD-172 SS1) TaxID=930990 RepID=A0A067M8X4_BOTB1|nr:hypothetical protein BOTBODRAFT_38252 [Botryobasidium botryosum FD-172 SS1]